MSTEVRPARKTKRFQLRLMTCVILVACAGPLIALNITERYQGGWGYGWPEIACVPGKSPVLLEKFDFNAVLFDAVSFLVLMGLIAGFSEALFYVRDAWWPKRKAAES